MKSYFENENIDKQLIKIARKLISMNIKFRLRNEVIQQMDVMNTQFAFYFTHIEKFFLLPTVRIKTQWPITFYSEV